MPAPRCSAHNTSAGAINDSGVVAGYFEPFSSTPRYGFTLIGSTFTTIDHSPFPNGSTTAEVPVAPVLTGRCSGGRRPPGAPRPRVARLKRVNLPRDRQNVLIWMSAATHYRASNS